MIRVLYVDDEAGLLEIGKLFLESLGEFSVNTVISASAALRLLNEQTFDAIISDYQMPGMDGIAFLKEVRQRAGEIPFILFTGRGREEIVIEAINNGVDFYIQKGGEPTAQFAELAHKIRQAVKRKNAETDLAENRDYLNQIFASVREGIIVIDATTHEIIDLNPAAEKMMGGTRDQVVGNICHKFMCPAEKGRCPITDLHQTVDDSERVLLTADGTRVPIIKYVVPFNFHGRACLIETIIDNTERKEVADELHAANAKITAAEEELRQNYDLLGEKEKALRESEERLRLFIQQAPAAMAMFDREMRYIAASHRWVASYHLENKEILGRSHYEVFPEISEDIKAIHRMALAGEVQSSDEDKFVRLDGSVQWLAWEVRPWYTTGNSIGGIIILSDDITKRKRAEEAHRESEEKYRTLVEYTLDGILILDPEGKILFANQAAGRLIGTDNYREVMGVKNVMEFIAPESQGDVIRDFNQVARGIDGYLARYKVITLQQQERWVESVGKSIIFEGAPAIQISLRDVTERQLAETATKESESRFRTIFDNSPYPIAINSLPDNKFLDVNAAFLEVSGYRKEEILGKNPLEMGLISLLEATRLISRRLLDGKIENVPLALTAEGGRRIHVLFTTIPITINDKAATLTVTAETTHLKRVEEELLQKNEDLNAAYEELTATEEELRANYDELNRHEQALRASEEKYRLMTEVTNDIIYMIDTQGTITYVSPGISRYGYTPEEVVNRRFTDFFPEEFVAQGFADLKKILSAEGPVLTLFKVHDRAGKGYWMENNMAPVSDSSGAVVAVSGILRDVTERKCAEEEMGKTEKKFRALVENSLDGIIITDFTGKLLFANQAAGRIIDATDLGHLIGKTNVLEFVAPESHTAVMQDFSQVAQGIDAYLVHYKLITEKNREVWVECVGRKIPFEDTEAMLVSMRDVTERKQDEVALRESEKKFAIMFRSNPVALTLVSAIDGKFMDVSDAFLDNTGYSREEVIGKTSEELRLFADMSEYGRLVSVLRETHRVDGMDVHCRTKSGEIRACRFSSGIILMDNKPHLLSTVEDITERKRTEDALHESEELFREVFSNANDGITLVENAPEGPGRFLLVNDRITHMLGYTRDELLLVSPRDLVPAEVMKKIQPDTIRKLLKDGEAVFESAYRRKDENIVPVEVSIHRFSYQGKDVSLGIVRDITERKLAGDALRQANKKLNLLSGITRHDIKNQLMTLDSFVELLHRDISEPTPQADKYLSRIRGASRQIAAMIQFTKEYEKVGVHLPVWQDFQVLVDNTGKNVMLGKVTLKNDIPAKTEVFADPLITKVVFNLIDNAVRHGGKITTIRFALETRDGDRILVCEDDGDGIEPGIKERIFDMGFGKNTGFGLAISREILDITGITIRETGVPGKGARFEITVPKNQYKSP